MSKRNPNKKQLQDFAHAIYDTICNPADMVEIRILPSRQQIWCRANELADQFAKLYRLNGQGQNIYIGANPRKGDGESEAEGVLLARTIFVDFDGVEIEEVNQRVAAAGLPDPTITLLSGHGVHLYWRLEDPIEDLAEWTQLQKALIAAVGSDPSIHDPPRIMRLPGFNNVKSEPHVACELLEANHNNVYGLPMLKAILSAHINPIEPAPATIPFTPPPTATLDTVGRATLYAAKVPAAGEGERNRAAFKLSAALVNDFQLADDDAWRLLEQWNNTNSPPLDHDELEVVFGSAHHSAKKPPGSKAESNVEPKVPIKHGSKSTGSSSKPKEKKEPEPTTAEILIKLSEAAELWHTPDGDGYATVKVGDHAEHYLIRSRGFRLWLDHQYFKATGSAPNGEARSSALSVIEAKSRFDGDEHPVNLRVAQHGESIYVDLCDENWQAVEITATGWRLTANPPVRFRRAKAMLSLPIPVAGGSVAELRQFINIEDEHWPLVVAWLVAALRPIGPYPVLCLHGEQGSAKSTGAKLLRSVVDPNTSPLRSEPREPRDLMIASANGWVAAVDNLSRIGGWLSDCLCRLSTGGGFSTRMLFENDEETIFNATRPIILTGIEEVATRGDLIDRSLLVSLPVIPESERRPEASLLAAFEEAKPRIFGAVLTAVSAAIANLPSTKLDRLPRMADFALWGTAAEISLGLAQGEFIRCYSGNRENANETALESSLVSKYIIPLADAADGWSGTASDLLAIINEEAGFERADGKPGKRPPKHWPGSPRSLSGELKRLAPNLRLAGIEIDFDRAGKKRIRTITIRHADIARNSSSASSASSATQVNPIADADLGADAKADDRRTQEDKADAKAVGGADANGTPAILRPPLRPPENAVTPEENEVADARDAADAKNHAMTEVVI